MQISNREKRLLIYHEYKLKTSRSETKEKICKSIGHGTVSLKTVNNWFNKFENKDFNLNELPRSGRQKTINRNEIKTLIEDDPRMSTRQIAEKVKYHHSTIEYILKELGKIYKHGIQIPHTLSREQKQVRIDSCIYLLSFKRNKNWLDYIITGDEKWIFYVNHINKKQWLNHDDKGIATVRGGHYEKKITLCVWWGTKGVIYWELLPENTTLNSQIYCKQLDSVAQKLKGKYKKVYFLHDNARPHISRMARKKIQDLKWINLPHPPYSPDLAPTDYHLFLSLSNHLKFKNYDEKKEVEDDLKIFFENKSMEFYRNGILSLYQRWEKVEENNGEYYN